MTTNIHAMPEPAGGSDERFLGSVEDVNDYASFMLELDGRVASWNPGAERIEGYTAQEILGVHFSRFYRQPEVARGWPEHQLQVARTQGRCDQAGWLVRKDGSRFWASIVLTALREGSGPLRGYSMLTRDLTPRKRAEALTESSQRMQLFLAMLAHELRNPLAPLRNAVRVMYVNPSPDPHIAWARDIIDRQVNHLSRLVDDLLDVGRITSGKIYLDRERIEIAAVVHQALESCQPLLDERQQQLTVHLGPQPLWVDGDLMRLSQALLNLLSNASKFTPMGGHIRVSVKQLDGHIELAVADTGVGISKELLPSVFEPFVQGDPSLDRMDGGLGVGLTLVKEIVTMHGGSIAAKSAGLNLGSEFTLRLPQFVAGETATGASHQSPQVPAAATHRILVVDDNRDSAETMAMLLQIGGHTVRVAFDGPSALPAVREFQPDLVLLDLGLPGLTGYEVAKKVQEMTLAHRPMLVAMTGYGQQGDRQRTRAAGFDHHLVKPVDLEMLQQILLTVPQRAGTS